jgi:predicted metal-dependent phosphoesterase TrpH
VRAAAHVHSEWSDDASWSLPEIARAFAKRGYDVVLLSEHSRGFRGDDWDSYRGACASASTDKILLVPGIEYNDDDNVVHIPVWGDVPFLGDQPSIADVIAKASGEGGVCVFAHPWRRDAWRRYDPAWSTFLHAVEIWNRKYNGFAPDRRAVALARREGLREFVALDFHTSRQFFPLAMRLELADETLGLRSVHDALSSGRFAPLAFSLHALHFLHGPAGAAVRAAEFARRHAARGLRALRRSS